MTSFQTTPAKPLLVVGAGIAGITSALEAAETGHHVLLLEQAHSVGGRVLRNLQYFPKMCPPSCGMEINTRRLEDNPRIRVLVGTHLIGASEVSGGWKVTIRQEPRYVNANCTACGECSKVCPEKVPDAFNLGLQQVPAIRLPHKGAWPHLYAIDREACPSGCDKCVAACEYGAIELNAKAKEEDLEVAAIIVATGWKPYPKENLKELGGNTLKDVISNVEMERIASPDGPTQGKILRPSTNEPPKKVAFVQCAGSRDVNHLAYCSAVCCLASLKQACYVRENIPEAQVTMYYIDRRTPGRNEDFLTKVSEMEGVRLVKGKVGKIEQDPNGSLKLRLEDVEQNTIVEESADLVVLATGMQPNVTEQDVPASLITRDQDGFGLENMEKGLLVAGVAHRPEEVAATVRDATGAAAKAIVAAQRSA